MTTESKIYIPDTDPTYVAWGDHYFLKSIVDRRRFFPVYVAGPSGTGKSIMVEQVCAELEREYCRIQITPETDEDQLIGGIRIKDGSTVFQDGPVIDAMRKGAVLLIDEIDRGSNKIMCLQGVMEGKPVVVKRTGEVVHPHPDFTVIATGNTKGRGDESGKYMAAVIIDDAFLERFPVTLIHEYPEESVESFILENHLNKFQCMDDLIHRALLRWARQNRQAAEDDDPVISTRRLCLIAESLSFFQGKPNPDLTAVRYATNRFSEEDQMSMMAAYEAIKPDIEAEDRAAKLSADLADRTANTKDKSENIAAKIIADYKQSQGKS